MKVAPVLMCRTKYIDYPNPVFCAPDGIDTTILQILHDSVNGQNLVNAPDRENDLILVNNNHIIIGKVLYIKDLNAEIDTQLDKEEGGRQAWGFIGGCIKKQEYIEEGKILTLPDDYYRTTYLDMLYNNHWRDTGGLTPLHSQYCDVDLTILDKPEFECPSGEIISDTYNKSVLWHTLYKIINERTGNNSCYTNAEYNAADLVSKGYFSTVTVSNRLFGIQTMSLNEHKKNFSSSYVNDSKKEPEPDNFKRERMEDGNEDTEKSCNFKTKKKFKKFSIGTICNQNNHESGYGIIWEKKR